MSKTHVVYLETSTTAEALAPTVAVAEEPATTVAGAEAEMTPIPEEEMTSIPEEEMTPIAEESTTPMPTAKHVVTSGVFHELFHAALQWTEKGVDGKFRSIVVGKEASFRCVR